MYREEGLFLCIEKASSPQLSGIEGEKLSAYQAFTNTLPQKFMSWSLPEFEKTPVLILCLTTLSR